MFAYDPETQNTLYVNSSFHCERVYFNWHFMRGWVQLENNRWQSPDLGEISEFVTLILSSLFEL